MVLEIHSVAFAHRRHHTSPLLKVENQYLPIEKVAQVGTLILNLFSAGYQEFDLILEEEQSVFSGAELIVEGPRFEAKYE